LENEQQKNTGNKGTKPRRFYRPKRKQNSASLENTKENTSKNAERYKISIIVPLFNEEESLNPLYEQIISSLTNMGKPDYEIIFVDDGSTDNSLNVIKELSQSDSNIKYISFRKNYGKSAALSLGFSHATGDIVITMDADLQDDPAEIPNLISKINEGYDLVSGWKKKRYDPFVKKYTSRLFNYITGIMSGIKLHDFNCGLKAYRKEVVKSIKVYGEMHRYLPVLAKWQGFTVSEIAVKHHARKYGKTKFGISRFFKGFVDLITVMFTTRYTKRPMHLFGFLGALSFFIGFLISIYLSYEWYFNHIALSNRPLLFLGMLLIIVGIQFFSTGLLGEFMVHTNFDEKEYNIKSKKV
jgi:glycosyltransferase involved in cell wall biosynthesis